MNWRDLPPIPDDVFELQRPQIEENPGANGVFVKFTDPLTRQWFAEWLRSKHCTESFGAWVDHRR